VLEARHGQEGSRSKKLIERAEFEFGEAGEIAAQQAAIERRNAKRAKAEGRPYVRAEVPSPPELLAGNEDAWELFSACSSQLILGGFGGVAGIRHDSLPWKMDSREIPHEERFAIEEKFRLIEAIFVKFCNRDLNTKGDRG
jgi:hypothetical protein